MPKTKLREGNTRHRSRSLRIGITGSPATGKKSVGRVLARQLSLEFVSLNDLAIKNNLGEWDKDGKEFLVDVDRLRGIRINTKGKVVCGHLLPYVIPASKLDFVAILRSSPVVLRRRYRSRGYPEQKSRENLEAELLDIISFDSLRKYGKKKVGEFDTSWKKSELVATAIVQTVLGRRSAHFGIEKWTRRKQEFLHSQ